MLNKPWLPGKDDPLLKTFNPSLEGFKVSNVMKIDRREWDEDVVKDLFDDRRDKEGNQGEEHSGFWRQLWRLKVPPKVKNLLWREVSGCLPTKSQLHLKDVAIDLYCPSCNVVMESIYHSLVRCSFAQEVWGILMLDVNVGDFEVFDVWFEAILQRFDHPRVEKIATVYWALWEARTNVVWNKKGVTAIALVTSALLLP
ncbi:uncharacterized protein LOC133779761 [Humulus lupulus]|uniref:uncharacterized protein LOC133779761 n=1 Tax=Humulus lupulus TaxID=3486 RepID=UPI002B414BEA|nr:uncharacterized protein LOC133779761 [Humulus lupulus]